MENSVVEQRESFRQNLTLGVVSTLEKIEGVEDVVFYDHGPSDTLAITSWEQRYSTLLPTEIKNFYLATDGLKLKWNLRYGGAKLPNTGCMVINRISDLRRVAGLRHSFDTEHPTLLDLEVTPSNKIKQPNEISREVTKTKEGIVKISLQVLRKYSFQANLHINIEKRAQFQNIYIYVVKHQKPQFGLRWKMFELDGCRGEGKVLLVFPPKPETFESTHITFDVAPVIPQVWFLDRAYEWHFLAPCFTNYFRMMLVHLGLPGWQTLFTNIGPTPWAKQIYNLIAPHLLNPHEDEDDKKGEPNNSPSFPRHVIDPSIFKIKNKSSSKKTEENKGGEYTTP
nr:tubulin polyglutamylase complex subunit 2-like [Lepeophtheirus salmonis]